MDRNIFCPECGYNLRGLKDGTCPECGLAFESAKLYAVLRRPRVTLAMLVIDLLMWPVLFWVLFVPCFLIAGYFSSLFTRTFIGSIYPGIAVTAVCLMMLAFVITRTICADLAQQTLELKRRRDPGGQYWPPSSYFALYVVIQAALMVIPALALIAILMR